MENPVFDKTCVSRLFYFLQFPSTYPSKVLVANQFVFHLHLAYEILRKQSNQHYHAPGFGVQFRYIILSVEQNRMDCHLTLKQQKGFLTFLIMFQHQIWNTFVFPASQEFLHNNLQNQYQFLLCEFRVCVHHLV